ncbi:translocase of chloroplast 159, chloroplastic-like isoform X2 [Amaranthus tricolor]|uniref:translocase of chloroplast 159, chloroplastic-like isoform X2 n=1 Tax=Amaranthus tricolor TaxID=29722 RepID=UPI00258D738B|nr:translocase of chloroplast 159, chloroplastic-like isoform X2 [Amaranthus tricolor]
MESGSQVDTTSLLAKQPSGLADSDDETLEKPIELGEIDTLASGSDVVSPDIGAPKVGLPVAKVSDDGDDDEIEDVSGEEDNGEIESELSRSFGVNKAPRVRVSGDDEEEGESEDEIFEEANEKIESDPLDDKTVDGDDKVDVELVNEEDAVVDSVNVDVVETVRSGVAVVQVEEEKLDSNVESEETVVGDKDSEVEFVVQVGEEDTSVVEEPALDASASVEVSEVKLTDEGDSIVDSIRVDAGEALRSVATIVGEVEETKDLESKETTDAENNVIEDFVSTLEDSVAEKPAVDDETLVKSIEVGEIDTLASGSDVVSPGIGDPKIGLPVAEISDDGDDDEVEDVSGGEDNGEVESELSRSFGVNKAPRVRVSGDDDEERESEDEIFEEANEKIVGDPLEDKTVGGDDKLDVELVNEEDAVVDSINVDVVEAVKSGVAVVQVEEEKLDSNVESAETVAGDKDNEVESEVQVGEEDTTVVEEPALNESASVEGSQVKLTDEEDSIVDSIRVDAGEALRSGAAIVGEVEGTKDLESKETTDVENNVIEDFVSTLEGSVAEKPALEESVEGAEVTGEKLTDKNVDAVEVVGEVEEAKDSESAAPTEAENNVIEEFVSTVEDSVVEEPADVDSKSLKEDEVKVLGEEDSIVDEINVDVVEAVRSGVAIVGDSEAAKMEKETEPEGKDVGAPVRANSSEIVDVEDLSNLAETPVSVEIDEKLLNTGEVNLENDESKQHESGDGVKFVSLGDQERVQGDPVNDTASDNIDQHEAKPVEGHDNGESDGDGEPVFFKDGVSSRAFMEELASGEHSEMIDGQVVTDSEEEADSDEEGEGRQLIDSAALAALLKAAASGNSDSSTITITSQDGSRLFSVERPAGLGTSLRSLRPASNSSNSNMFAQPNVISASEDSLSEEDKKKLHKIHELRVKFLRLIQRLGQTAEQSVAAQVLYKLAMFAGRTAIPTFSLDNAKQTASLLEAEGNEDLDFSLNILVLGKTGVGKSATINSIFGEEKVKINAFEPETTSVNVVNGIVNGVKIRVIDAPGLKSSALEQGFNRKVLASVKKITKKYSPDLLLYVDRLDSQTRDLNDLPILRTITSSLGSSIWRSAILTLTHAACAPPDGPSGAPLGYDVFVGQRSHIIQQSIGQAVGDLRFMNLGMMNPVSLVENHPACRKNREGDKVLPNGQAWRPQLLLLCYSLKILADASVASKPQDPVDHRKLFGFRVRSPPLPYLLSSLLQPRTHPKLSADQGGENGDSDIDLDDFSDSDQEEDEYDELPPFKPLRKTQLAKLSGEQRKAYFDEYDYRVKLLQKKQWREELKRLREIKKNGKINLNDPSDMPEDYDAENGAPAAVPVPLPDMVLPPSFDSDTPAYRYRFLEPTSQFLARPVLDTHGWDHDCGYDGVNVEQNIGIAGRFPAAVTVQVTKDKKDFNIHLDSAVSAKHGENGSSLVGFDVQTIGKQLAYIIKGETKFKNLKKNKTAGGISVTFLGENVATGVKLEDQISLGKRLVFVGSTGTVRSQKDAAYGANLELRLKDADHPINQDQSSFVLSLMKWRGDLAIGGNVQSQISVGRNAKMAVRVALNNKQSGQITVKTSTSDHLALAYAGLVPIALAIYQKFWPNASENYSIY